VDKLTLLGGVRAERTDFDTKGWRTQGAANPVFSRASASRSYTDVLPGLHAVYKFTPKLQGRASLSQTLSRPNFPDSAFRVTVGDDGNITQGNTQLKPYHATNYDASLEYYPGKSLGVLSAGVFAKRIDDFIFAQTIAGGAPNGINDLTTPLNGKRANIKGAEFGYQQQFTFLPPPFDGLGLFLNYTMTRGDADLGAARPGEKMPFLQQSKRIANLALSYEKHGFLLRVSLNYRSAYLDTIGATASDDLYVDTHTQIDLTSNYKLTRHFTVFAEVLNLTDEPYHSYYNVSFRNRKTEYYRWSANTGVRYNF
jgi:TonB-dependent receptor